MSLVTPAQLVSLYGCPYVRASNFAEWLNAAMWESGIVTPARVAAFLAQIGHESGRLRYTREIWGPTPQQQRYERDFGAPWPEVAKRAVGAIYARNRLAHTLGNTEAGDGKRYMGRGLIQITGRSNYAQLSAAMGEDFITHPALLETPKWAARSAGWYWLSRGLSTEADLGEFDAITRRINGGQNGRADRVALHERAQAIVV